MDQTGDSVSQPPAENVQWNVRYDVKDAQDQVVRGGVVAIMAATREEALTAASEAISGTLTESEAVFEITEAEIA